MEQQIRFCTSADGTRIGYATYGGNARPPLVVVPAWGHDIEAWWMAEWSRRYVEIEARHRRVVEYDRRGSGVSQREVSNLSLSAQLADLCAIVDTINLSRFELVGWLDGSPIAMSYAARYPERVSRLVLCNPFAAANDCPLGRTAHQTAHMIRTDWSLARRAMATVGIPTGPVELQRWWSQVIKGSVAQELAARHFEEYIAGLDVTSELRDVRAPTLVLYFNEEPMVTVEASRSVATAISDARFVSVTGPTRVYQDKFEAVVLPFLDEQADEDNTVLQPSGLTVILFADIASSTALTERLGDTAFREKARTLDAALRGAIADAGGSAVDGKLLGDGVLAVFTSAREAIACAGACHTAASDADLQLHIGIHAGDVIREEGNIYGGAVNTAARVSDSSGAGETLVSQTVRDLARTSAGVVFEDRGERQLKGIEEPVRVWAVRSA